MVLKKAETVNFDPSIKEHRNAVRSFLKRVAWSDSPIRFSHDPAYDSMADQVCSKLLAWYLSQEQTRSSRSRKAKSQV